MDLTRFTVSGLLLAATATSAYAAQCTNDVWKKVMSRGEVVVGVKADYKPWGYRDSRRQDRRHGASILAKIAADAMGVELETGGRSVVQPHAVPGAGQDRHDDRHHV